MAGARHCNDGDAGTVERHLITAAPRVADIFKQEKSVQLMAGHGPAGGHAAGLQEWYALQQRAGRPCLPATLADSSAAAAGDQVTVHFLASSAGC